MLTLSAVEALTKNFYDWELVGRGWRSYPHPVPLEPVFRPFPGHFRFVSSQVDDARKPTLLSGLWDRVLVRPEPAAHVGIFDSEFDPTPEPLNRNSSLVELEILVPAEAKIDSAASEAWLRTISASTGPISFELVGSAGAVYVRIVINASDADLVRGQLAAYFPIVVSRDAPPLEELWLNVDSSFYGALEFGLAREFMLPLSTFRAAPDPLTPFIGALARVRMGEVAVVQVLFESTNGAWGSSGIRAVTAPDGEPFFADAPNITTLAEEKCSAPLYAAALRVAARCRSEDRTWDVLRSVGGALAQYGSPDRNDLVPLATDDVEDLVNDILSRTTRRSGMILSLPELSSLVRLPGESVRSPALVRVPEPEETLPREVLGESGIVLGEANHKGHMVPVRLTDEARSQHVYVIGGTGTGKSTLLQQLILQDIGAGAGVGVLDPHGDLIEDILARIPENRIDDVVLFDPSDPDTVVGWNILGAHSDLEKDLLASDLVAVFRRLSTSWGDQMNAVLANAVLAFLESNRGGTLLDLRRFLVDEAFRVAFLSTVEDPYVVSFWREEYPLLAGKRPQAPILTRLDTFLRSRLVREAVTEENRPLNFRAMIDDGAIFLAKLSQGAIGEENAALLGSLLVSKFHQVSLSRQDTAIASRRPFYLYMDEFQHMATPSMAGLFSGVRKYRLGLTVAHQDLYQLHAGMPEVERAILANAHTRMVFRVSDDDARKLEKGMEGFTADDLANLGRGTAICRVGRKETAFRLKTAPLDDISLEEAERQRSEVRTASMTRYGRPREKRGIVPESVLSRPASRKHSTPHRAAEPASNQELHPPTPDLLPGRGGAVHKYVQGLIKEWARAQGFRAEIEMQLPDGKRIDVVLVRGEVKIACEIAGTTTIEQETANIGKCLDGPFSHVAAISLDRSFLGQLETALKKRLAASDMERVSILSPEEFLAFLQSHGPETSKSRVRGYSVTVRHKAGSGSEDEVRRRAVTDVMLKSVKRMREKSP